MTRVTTWGYVCTCGHIFVRAPWAGEGITHLGEAAVEAGGPATLGARGPAAQALAAKDAVAALGVGAPCQVGAALHIAPQEGLFILQGRRATGEACWDTKPPSSGMLGLFGEVYLGDDLWRGDDGPDEGPGGLSRAVSYGAGAVQHKVLLNPCGQVLIPA